MKSLYGMGHIIRNLLQKDQNHNPLFQVHRIFQSQYLTGQTI